MVQLAARRGEVSSFGAPAEAASGFHTPLGTQYSVRQEPNFLSKVQGDPSKWLKPPVDLVTSVPADVGPLL